MVDLLGEDDAGEFVGHGEGGEGEQEVGAKRPPLPKLASAFMKCRHFLSCRLGALTY